MLVRRFTDTDAEATSALIRLTLDRSNRGDYPPAAIDALIQRHTPDYVRERAAHTHFYVAEDGGRIVGCGAIGPYWGRTDESSLFSFFVHPDRQRTGIGRALMEALERDAYALSASRIEVPASITGLPFYLAMGYRKKPGPPGPDEKGLYRLEKGFPRG